MFNTNTTQTHITYYVCMYSGSCSIASRFILNMLCSCYLQQFVYMLSIQYRCRECVKEIFFLFVGYWVFYLVSFGHILNEVRVWCKFSFVKIFFFFVLVIFRFAFDLTVCLVSSLVRSLERFLIHIGGSTVLMMLVRQTMQCVNIE